MKTSKFKVGRYPLQKIGGELRPGHYESADYLYEHSQGFVWLRVVHDLSMRIYSLSLEFVYQGYKHSQQQPFGRVVAYSERDLCRAAKALADHSILPTT